jgi:hypothetical protein
VVNTLLLGTRPWKRIIISPSVPHSKVTRVKQRLVNKHDLKGFSRVRRKNLGKMIENQDFAG